MQEDVIYAILSVVEEIPEGKVATYGQVARLIGRERNARLVGKVLGRAGVLWDLSLPSGGESRGRLAPGWPEQRALLEAEGVALRDDIHVDLSRFGWRC